MTSGEGSSPARRTRRAPQSDRNASAKNGSATRKRKSTRQLIREAREQFEEVTGREVENVSAFGKTDEGWELDVEVVELERIPDTTSVLASYKVRLEQNGEFVGYERLRRYSRGQIDL